jgi:predicted transcriptional regulator
MSNEKQTMMIKKLAAKEEEVMTLFWQHGDMFIRDLLNYYEDPKPHYNTVATQVKFLEEKKFLGRRPMGNTNQYYALISEKEYKGSALSMVISQYFNNSYTSVVSHFIEEEAMDLDELKELIELIERKRKL